MPILLGLFIVVPLIEIGLFIAVGQQLGLWTTLLIVVITAFVGAALVSRQGRGVIREVQDAVRQGVFPGRELAHGAMILVSGALLITPGFLTDAVGFLLLVPSVREMLRRWGARRMQGRVQVL
jgi:UPF0716 protein FxsA